MPTLAELSGAKLPENQPVDGVSIAPLLRGGTLKDERAIFWHYPLYLTGAQYNQVVPIHGTEIPYWRATPCSVIRRGDWKLMHFFEDDKVELYHLKNDLGEKTDLALKEVQKAASLKEELQAWWRDTEAVIPTAPNPDFDPGAVRTNRGARNR